MKGREGGESLATKSDGNQKAFIEKGLTSYELAELLSPSTVYTRAFTRCGAGRFLLGTPSPPRGDGRFW